MRKIGRSEIVLWKCPTCGSNNKIYTILEDSCGNRIGSSLKCCECGHLLKRLDDPAATVKDEIGDSYPGRQYCIKLHRCKNYKNCPIRNHSYDGGDDSDSQKPCIDCNTCPYSKCCKKQNSDKLIIKVNDTEKYL